VHNVLNIYELNFCVMRFDIFDGVTDNPTGL